ncbi:hypothetical protein Tco_1080542 [Tanacetum coccineum]|uniref:Uncharacterized protein n=1 Tax=Tanacetum coccineum TaxID=301880 RepID=A0ABQ5HUZ4_9ASTR
MGYGSGVILKSVDSFNSLLKTIGVINPPCYHNQELASPEQTATADVVPKYIVGSSFSAASSKLLPFAGSRLVMFGSNAMKTNLLDTRSAQCSMLIIISFLKVFVCRNSDLCRSFMCSSQASSRLDVAVKFIFQSSRYVVPTGRVVVPTGRYVVPAGKVIIIVSPSRLNLVPTGRILSPGRVK